MVVMMCTWIPGLWLVSGGCYEHWVLSLLTMCNCHELEAGAGVSDGDWSRGPGLVCSLWTLARGGPTVTATLHGPRAERERGPWRHDIMTHPPGHTHSHNDQGALGVRSHMRSSGQGGEWSGLMRQMRHCQAEHEYWGQKNTNREK